MKQLQKENNANGKYAWLSAQFCKMALALRCSKHRVTSQGRSIMGWGFFYLAERRGRWQLSRCADLGSIVPIGFAEEC